MQVKIRSQCTASDLLNGTIMQGTSIRSASREPLLVALLAIPTLALGVWWTPLWALANRSLPVAVP